MNGSGIGYFCLSIFILCLLTGVECKDWSECMTLDIREKFHVCWNITQESEAIEFLVEVEAHGYVGFGLSPRGSMAGSDIVTGWIRDGRIYFQDRHGNGNFLPKIDASSDWHVISGRENDTHTTFIFRRKLDTCDKDDLKIDDSTLKLIYAYSDVDPSSEADLSYPLENRGSKSAILFRNRGQNHSKTIDKTSLSLWTVLAPNVSITSNTTTLYWCKIYKAPEINEKKHIVLVEPFFSRGSEGLVHHLLLYECVGGVPQEFEPHARSYGHKCHYGDKYDALGKCEGIIFSWAIGAKSALLPENIGIPLNPGVRKYYKLEIHYDNPLRREGIVDSSGLKIYYTDELKEFDAGILTVGAIVRRASFVPPKQTKFTIAGHSSSECLNPVLPTEGLKLIGLGLHAHSIGREIKVRHFRNNTELPPISEDCNFDFRYQQWRYLSEERVILPGDQITVECTYDSSERSIVTFGGEGTDAEMCIAILMYYPRVERFFSLSVPQFSVINKALDTNFTVADTFNGRLEVVLSEFDWSSVNISDVERILRYGKHNSLCVYGNGLKLVGKIPVSYPETFRPFEKVSTCIPQEDERMNEIKKFMM